MIVFCLSASLPSSFVSFFFVVVTVSLSFVSFHVVVCVLSVTQEYLVRACVGYFSLCACVFWDKNLLRFVPFVVSCFLFQNPRDGTKKIKST